MEKKKHATAHTWMQITVYST